MLNEFRFFDPDPQVRRLAHELYLGVKDLPIVSLHEHIDPKLLADNEPLPNPAELIIMPDHYIYRILYSHGRRRERRSVAA